MHVIWSDETPPPPPDGAEIVVLLGHLDHTLARVLWSDGAASGTWLAERDDWSGTGDAAPPLGAARFAVEPRRFLVAWTAARMVLGARAERKEPPPELVGLSMSGTRGSHEASLVARLREGGTTLHEFEQSGTSRVGGIRAWDEIRDRAVHRLLADLVPEGVEGREPITLWLPFVRASLEDVADRRPPDLGEFDRVLLGVVVRAAAEIGDTGCLPALDWLRSWLSGIDGGWYAERLLGDVNAARVRTLLRARWSAERAEAALLAAEPGRDLATAVRSMWRAREPETYRAALVRHTREPGLARAVVRAALDEIRAHFPEARGEAHEALLRHPDPELRVDAALGLLEERHAGATAALRELVADTSVRRPGDAIRGEWPRSRALRGLVAAGVLGPEELRRLAATPEQDGALIEVVEEQLEGLGRPLTAVEAREAYRRVLDQPPHGGTLVAIRRLLDLDDRASFARMRELLAPLADAPAEGEPDALGYRARRHVIPKLLERLGD